MLLQKVVILKQAPFCHFLCSFNNLYSTFPAGSFSVQCIYFCLSGIGYPPLLPDSYYGWSLEEDIFVKLLLLD